MTKGLFILLLVFCFSNVFGIGEKQIVFNNIDNKQGLSQNGVHVIFQDKDGYIWFGSHYGLNRYDGFNIKTYYSDDTKNGLAGNTIVSIVQDSIGNIWISTSGGLCVFNPVSEKLFNLKKYNKNQNTFNESIESMIFVRNQIIYSTYDELWTIDQIDYLFTEELAAEFCKGNSCRKLECDTGLRAIKVHIKDKNENYWLTSNKGVLISKIVGEHLLIIDEFNVDDNLDTESAVIYEDNFSNLWIGTSNNGLYRINENKGRYSSISVYGGNGSKVSFSRVTSLAQDNENNLWVSSRGDGVIIIREGDLGKKDIVPLRLNNTELPNKKIKRVFKSRDNTMWLGSLGNGVFSYNASSKKFKNHQFSDKSNNTSVSYTRSIIKDSHNRLWFGTLFNGLYIFDSNSQKTNKYLFENNSVFAFSEIDDNHILAGCTGGLYLITYTQKSIKAEKILLDNFEGTVFSICNKLNKYWIGTNKNIVSFTLGNDYKAEQVISYNNELFWDSNVQNIIRCIKYDSIRNCLWIGSENNGLVKAELDNENNIKQFVSINRQLKDRISLSTYVGDIHIDNDNNVWAATRDGLVQLQIRPGGEVSDVRIYSTKDGLPSNLIQSIQSDNTGNLWLGTNRGLVKLNKISHEVLNFDINDGIQDYEFAEHASFRDKDGNMYFGGINGVSEFSPDKIIVNNSVEQVIISDVIVNGESAKEKIDFNKSDLLSLNHIEDNLRFNFIAFNYINPLKCNYAYMLEGYDKDWTQTAADNRVAEYSNLPKGNYTFKVKASNEDGIWNSDYTEFSLQILPSFWITYPAFIIYVFILLLLTFLVSTITKKRVKRKQQELLEKQYHEHIEKINQAKLQFFINISHEIRTPLTLIVCSVEKLIANFKLNKKQEKEAVTIDKNVNRMLQLTNELLEIRKIETGNYQINVRNNDIVLFLRNTLLAFESLADKLDIKLTIESYKPEVSFWYDANALEKVFYNLISNAIKYTNKGGSILIKVEPSTKPDCIALSVIDNGIGIDKEHLPKIFERFHHYGGNKNSYENGFGIGLSLTKNLIELHKGTISVTSEPGKGSNFTVHLSTNETIYSSDDKADKVIRKTDFSSVLEGLEKRKLKESKTDVPNYEIGNLDKTKAKILFIDDNEELLENVSDYLSEQYNVIVAPNGKIGYEMAKQNQPDVILSDIVMPVMDGFELCNKLKNDVVTSHIPIILLTARGDSDSQFKGIETGADYFIPKPFNIKLLNLRIKNLIEAKDKLKKRFLSNQYSDAKEITTNNKDAQFMHKLLQYVNEHIAEPDLNINFIADNLGMSRSTFFRKIKAITGTTGKEFIDSVRFKKATQLLTESDLNISEIAYDIGHSSPQYFSKWFKAHYQMSPSEYISKHRTEQ